MVVCAMTGILLLLRKLRPCIRRDQRSYADVWGIPVKECGFCRVPVGLFGERYLVFASAYAKNENPFPLLRNAKISGVGFKDGTGVAVCLRIGHKTEEGGFVGWV